MSREIIINYKINPIKSFIPVNDVYIIRKKNKLINYIIKLLLKNKFIAQYQETEVKYERIEIKRDKVLDLIKDYQDAIYRNSNYKPISVIIGHNKFKQLEVECFQEMRFNIPIELIGGEGRKIFGLEIILNPYIDGLVLV